MMDVTGSCHCGAVAYCASIDAQQVTLCHCIDCQKLTGSAYRVSVPAQRGTFRLLAGAPTIYVKIGASGAHRAQAFCASCGSPLYTYALATPEQIGLRVGCIDQRRQLTPVRQKWCNAALPWVMALDSLPKRPEE